MPKELIQRNKKVQLLDWVDGEQLYVKWSTVKFNKTIIQLKGDTDSIKSDLVYLLLTWLISVASQRNNEILLLLHYCPCLRTADYICYLYPILYQIIKIYKQKLFHIILV